MKQIEATYRADISGSYKRIRVYIDEEITAIRGSVAMLVKYKLVK